MKTLLIAIILVLASASAQSQEMKYDSKQAQNAEVFKILTYRTLTCMQQSATFVARSGQTNRKEAILWMATTCGRPFHNFSVQALGIESSRVEAVLASMAEDQLRLVPGLK